LEISLLVSAKLFHSLLLRLERRNSEELSLCNGAELRSSESGVSNCQCFMDAGMPVPSSDEVPCHGLCQQSSSWHFRREQGQVNYLLRRVWRLIKVEGDHPKCLEHDPQKTLPGFAGEEGYLLPGMAVLTTKPGIATSQLVSRARYVSCFFSLTFCIFGCQK